MRFWNFLIVFLPIGIVVLWNPHDLASSYRRELVRLGIPSLMVTFLALAWTLVGAAALFVVTLSLVGVP